MTHKMADDDIENDEGINEVEDNNVVDKTDNLNHRKRFYCFTPQRIRS